MSNILVCMFVYKPFLDNALKTVTGRYHLPKRKIFIFENADNKNEAFCTFNISRREKLLKGMIPVHRKSESDTIYTINALNEIVKKMNNNVISEEVEVPWENYRNKLLLTDENDELKEINLNFSKLLHV